MSKLYIGNCSFNLDDSALQSFIESNGVQVSSVQVIKDKFSGRSRGFGFAELAGSQSVESAIEALNGKEVDGRPLNVSEAREQQPRFNSGGFGGNASEGRSSFRGNGKRADRW